MTAFLIANVKLCLFLALVNFFRKLPILELDVLLRELASIYSILHKKPEFSRYARTMKSVYAIGEISIPMEMMDGEPGIS